MGKILSIVYRVFNFISPRKTENQAAINVDHSLHLHNVLEYIGASEEVRNICRDTAMTREITATILKKIFLRKNISEYIFGSTIEGTSTHGLKSDIDYLFSLDSVSLSETILPVKHSQLLMIRDHHTKPGYVKLWHVLNKIPLMSGMRPLSDVESIDTNGKVVINHFSLVGVLEFLSERCGPADTKTEKGVDKGGDFVSAFRCKSIPSFANDWVKRSRKNGWPTVQQLELMETYGCFVVGVGHPASAERGLEWRISFSLQERELMFSLNSTQHKCYILFKLIKKGILEAKLGKCISSYHCKTALFHTIENTPKLYWVLENTLYCFKLCLNQLFTWLIVENCPNFFISEENMFERLSREKMNSTANLIEKLLSRGCTSIIRSLSLDDISRRMVLCEKGVEINQVRSDEASRLLLLSMCDRAKIYHDVVKTILQSLGLKHSITLVPRLLSTLNKLRRIERVTEHKEIDVKNSIRGVLARLHLYVAKLIAVQIVQTTDQYLSRIRQAAFELHLQQTGNFDLLSAKLVKATLHQRTGKTAASDDTLKEFEENFVWSYCGCDHKPTFVNPVVLDEVRTKRLTVEDAVRLHTTSCMLFHISEHDMVPVALAFEIDLAVNKTSDHDSDGPTNWIAVDTKVYFYYLKYLIFSEWKMFQRKVFWAEQLRFCLATDPNLGHRQIGYNILSWIFVDLNEELLAFGCLFYSWWTKPNRSALWLALLLIFKRKQQMLCILPPSS